MDAKDKRYDYNRFNSKGKRVGQAVIDILSKDNPEQTVEETLDAAAPEYLKQFEEAVQIGVEKGFRGDFYIFVLTKKEMWACNVVRNFFITRKTAPSGLDMMCEYPHHTKTLYRVNHEVGTVHVLWSLPGFEECKSVLKNKANHSPELVKWIEDCMDGKLDSPDQDPSPGSKVSYFQPTNPFSNLSV